MFYWVFLGLCGLLFAAGVLRHRTAVWRGARTGAGGARKSDLLLLAGLVPVALFAVQPYVGRDLVGAGDSYFYALQVGDFVTQTRAGVMPVFVGQSDYAFNGNIHPVRTAPYFTHLAGLLDFLTWHRWSFVALQNLAVAVTSVLAAWLAFGATLHASGGRRAVAWLLAAAYVLSPAIMGPLNLNDMYATYLAAPWLVACWGGIAGILRDEDDLRAQLVAAGALGMTWYAHPPVAAWLSIAWGLAQLGRLALAGGRAGQWGRQTAGVLLLGGLGAYVFGSVALLGPGPAIPVPPLRFDGAMVQDIFRQEFIPVALGNAHIQLGWTLWTLLLGTLALLAWRRPGPGLLFTALILPFVAWHLRIPPVSAWLWQAVPGALRAQTVWPEQRLCPVLAAGIAIGFAAVLRDVAAPRLHRLACAGMALGVAWSAAEAAALNRRPTLSRLPPAAYDVKFTPGSVQLTRYSYAYFARFPDYYTHGWTDPRFESRLLDARLDPAGDDTQAILASAPPGTMVPIPGRLVLSLDGPGEYLLVFAFAEPGATGEIVLQGPGFRRSYLLPSSGQPLAFGSGPTHARTLPLALREQGPQQVAVSATVPGVSVRAIRFAAESLPIRLASQTPYTAAVRAPFPSFLETPRVFLPGYTATVNGRATGVRRSPQDLVMLPVPEGDSEVVVRYTGPALLRASWLLALASFAAWPWLLAWSPPAGPALSLPRVREANLAAGLGRAWRRNRRGVVVAALLAAGLATALPPALRAMQEHAAYGAMRLVVEFAKQPAARNEPLVTLGVPGAADCLYVIREDEAHLRFGFDHWGSPLQLSDPLPLDPARRHVIEYSIGGLYPPSRWFAREGPTHGNRAGTARLYVSFDGQVVFAQDLPYYPVAPDRIALGTNPAGSSVAGIRFSGRILAVERFVSAATGFTGPR